MRQTESKEDLIGSRENIKNSLENVGEAETSLTQIEKRFLLLAERGDIASVRR